MTKIYLTIILLFVSIIELKAMLKSLNTASAGMTAMQNQLDTISNNIANINTIGYKKSRVNIQDLTYQTLKEAGSKTSTTTELASPLQVGTGAKVVSVQKDFTMGSPIVTNNPLDLMIEGRGFFQIALPDGQIAYTRDGAFHKDSTGRIVNAEGYPLIPETIIPPNAVGLAISNDGMINVQIAGQNAITSIGQIQIADFVNPGGLTSIGKNLFLATPASGTPIIVNPGQNGTGQIAQMQLEASNVNIVTEMVDMIKTQRSYEMNSKIIQASDQMLQIIAGMK